MSLVNVRGVMLAPGFISRVDRGMAINQSTLDASGEQCGAVIQIPKTGTLTKIGVRVMALTTADVLKVSLQTVDAATGGPSGTLYKTNAFGTIDTPTVTTTFWVPLNSGNGISAVAGDIVAIVVEFNDFVAGNLSIARGVTNTPSYGSAFPYTWENTGGSLSIAYYPFNFGLEYSTGIEHCAGGFPAVANASDAFNNTSNPDRRGLRFQVPYNCRVLGAFVDASVGENASLMLYDTDGTTVLETITLDKDLRNTSSMILFRMFSQPRTLTKDSYYRLVLLPATSTNITLYDLLTYDDGSSEAMNAVDGGTYFHFTTANGEPTEEADWTNTSTKRPLMGLIIDQLDNGESSGSGSGRIPRIRNHGV